MIDNLNHALEHAKGCVSESAKEVIERFERGEGR